MARVIDLMGLNIPANQARIQANDPSNSINLTAVGGTAASAFVIGGAQYLTSFTASNAGAGALLPPVGGFTGCLLGDDFIVNNQIVGGVHVYGPVGSSISFNGSFVSGSAGCSLSSHTTAAFYPISASTWICIQGT
jgi:hypothetical protein